MIVLRGKRRGMEVVGHQFCNDWLTATGPNGEPLTLSPLSVQLTTAADREFFTSKDPANCGTFWQEFRLLPNGRFESTRPRRPRRRRAT